MWEQLPPHLKLSEEKFYIDDLRLRESHRLCRDAGIDVTLSCPIDVLGDLALFEFLSRYSMVISYAREHFHGLHRKFLDHSYTFLLTDSSGRIVELFSSPEVVARCARSDIRPGAALNELSCGTNAVSLALRYSEPVVLRGDQHYCEVFQQWYCVAVPIVSNANEMLGCVDLSMGFDTRLGEKLPLMMVLAKQFAPVMARVQHPVCRAHRDTVSEDQLACALTKRQSIIFDLLCQGLGTKEVASALEVSTRTVESHLERMRKKFNAKTTVALIAKLSDLNSRSM